MYENNPEVYIKNRLCVLIAIIDEYPCNPPRISLNLPTQPAALLGRAKVVGFLSDFCVAEEVPIYYIMVTYLGNKSVRCMAWIFLDLSVLGHHSRSRWESMCMCRSWSTEAILRSLNFWLPLSDVLSHGRLPLSRCSMLTLDNLKTG